MRLQERLEKPEEDLHRTCRFESDIATFAPAGLVAPTFDDGREPGHAEQILAVLAGHHVPATFFLIAEKAKAHPELVEQARALPGAVTGNHSWSHPNFHDMPVSEQAPTSAPRRCSTVRTATPAARPASACAPWAIASSAGTSTPATGPSTAPRA